MQHPIVVDGAKSPGEVLDERISTTSSDDEEYRKALKIAPGGSLDYLMKTWNGKPTLLTKTIEKFPMVPSASCPIAVELNWAVRWCTFAFTIATQLFCNAVFLRNDWSKSSAQLSLEAQSRPTDLDTQLSHTPHWDVRKFGYMARNSLPSVYGNLKQGEIESAMVCEARTPADLPERVLACSALRMNGFDVLTSKWEAEA